MLQPVSSLLAKRLTVLGFCMRLTVLGFYMRLTGIRVHGINLPLRLLCQLAGLDVVLRQQVA